NAWFTAYVHRRELHSFPTRRSSDLGPLDGVLQRHHGGVDLSAAERVQDGRDGRVGDVLGLGGLGEGQQRGLGEGAPRTQVGVARSEEHTSELQSRENLVCRLLLEKK